MKRFTSVLLALTLAAGLFVFSACSSENTPPADLSDISSASSTDASETSPAVSESSSEATSDVMSSEKTADVTASGKWGDLDWSLDSSGTLTILGQGDMDDFNYYYHYSSDAWRKYVDLVEYSGSIKKVVITDGVTSIGERAFSSCTALTDANIPDSVTSIENSAFSACISLTGVTIPDGVASIEKWAFSNCEALTEINIPESVTSIDDWAFGNCSALKLVFVKSRDIASGLDSSDSAGELISYAETVILGPVCTATDYIRESFPYTGTTTVGGESCTWYRKTEECTAHYYEDGSGVCAICGASS